MDKKPHILYKNRICNDNCSGSSNSQELFDDKVREASNSQDSFEEQSYNFIQLKQEIFRLKQHDLILKVNKIKTSIEQQIKNDTTKTVNLENVIDLFIKSQARMQ
ncbi:4766_t:CDS:2 [Dentiscutata heterogama]|uniref:4766_t:CDS:1 n=1 Tax=Dentiscutata heterogama TaxID=1316150 RepID=A0ACA9LDZ7_9GLOM|nr:4766_t:CDS:2 [Dentiscutata heterogama]